MSDAPPPEAPYLRPPWSRSERRLPTRVVQPLQAFLHTEASGGILLLAAAILAIAWANSPWSASYEQLWRAEFSLAFGRWSFAMDLHHLVNDAFMALFFFVVGLEIKREVLTGELRDPRAAALPVIAAVGGMVVPALLYLALNAGSPAARGWGIPMATDIAFALGVLTIAARMAPPGLKSFLLTLAIVDDIGAIVVIALFYSGGVSMAPLLWALVIIGAIVVLRQIHVVWTAIYWILGLLLWYAVYRSGVHATIAGVVLGLLTPARPFQRPAAVSAEARKVAAETSDAPDPGDADAERWLALSRLSGEAVSPLARLESQLHPWTSFLIVPIFALANAGVHLSGEAFMAALSSPVTLGIILGLVFGKTLGISLAAWVAVRSGLGRLPDRVTWPGVYGAAAVAGIGFTVALFVAEVAFDDPVIGDQARVGILLASLVAGVLGFGLLRRSRA